MTKLCILWTSGDKEVAEKMVFMYTMNSKKNKWWNQVRLILWGPSDLLVANDKEIQKSIKEMIGNGIEVWACKSCSDMYGVSDILKSIRIDVHYVGVEFTETLKGDWKVLTL